MNNQDKNDETQQTESSHLNKDRFGTGLKKNRSNNRLKSIFSVIIILFIFGCLAFKVLHKPKATKATANQDTAQDGGHVDTHAFSLPNPTTKTVTATATTDNTTPNNPPPQTMDQGGFIGGHRQSDNGGFSRSLGGVMVVSGNGDSSGQTTRGAASGIAYDKSAEEAPETPTADNSPVIQAKSDSDIYGASHFQAGTVSKSTFDPNLLLEKGTYIPCVMRHAFNSNVDGQISCVVADDVYSSAGTVKLIEKGSRVNGVYKGGNVNAGSDEMFVIWQEIRTPNNLVVNVNSGSSDELGNAGLGGYVDYHWGIKLGMASLVSLVNVTGQNLSTQLAKNLGGNNNSSSNSGDDNPSSVVTEILRQYANVRPTLYKNQGDKVGIFVARDIDFSSVYKLKANADE